MYLAAIADAQPPPPTPGPSPSTAVAAQVVCDDKTQLRSITEI